MKETIAHILFLFLSFTALGLDINSSSATALNTVTLYKDSTFIQDTKDYSEGTFFKVLETSYYEHPDGDQKQKFKWFKVETEDQQIGWVFGDGLAVFVPREQLSEVLLPFHNAKISLGQGFQNATTWIAAIQGRDNFHAQDYMNPLYSEYYLVITNQKGKSVMLKCAGESARGETIVHQITMKDVTSDNYTDIIIERGTSTYESELDERELEIFSYKAGTLTSVFLEHLTLSYDTNIPSPALYKYVEIDPRYIRVSYVNYALSTATTSQKNIPVNHQNERGIEYITTYYKWDKRQKVFKNLYGNSASTLFANPRGNDNGATIIRTSPSKDATVVERIYQLEDVINVFKHYEKYVLENGQKKIEHWFFVETSDGSKMGYIPAKSVYFTDIDHAELLNSYYANPPLSKSEWKADARTFLKGLE